MSYLDIFGSMLVNPYTFYALQFLIASNLVRIVPSKKEEPELDRKSTFLKNYQDQPGDLKRKNLLHNLIKSFSLDEPFRPSSFCKSFYDKCRLPKRYKRFKRAQEKILKELDLLKFIESKRLQMSATVGLLTPKQKLIISEFSQVIIHESSHNDISNSSDDGKDVA